MEDQLQLFDNEPSNGKSLLNIELDRLLEPIENGKYVKIFRENEIDYKTFITLEDEDLKELGIKALGSRKKILNVIKECGGM
jgi:hypothetical protein